MAIINPSRLADRANGPYTAEEELQINQGDVGEKTATKLGLDADQPATMTLDQMQRGLGIKTTHVPKGTSDVVPAKDMTFVDRDGRELSYAEVTANVGKFLQGAKALEEAYRIIRRDAGPINPVESAIAYSRNATGQRAEQGLGALETDLVKFSVLGFQIGAERDRKTMRKLGAMCGKLVEGLAQNRDLRNDHAVFELGTRKLPEGLPYLVIAGVRESIEYVFKELKFTEEVIQFLKHEVPATKGWTDEHWNYLRNFDQELAKVKISGLPDGSIYTGSNNAAGPMIRVEGPPAVAEFIETALLARISAMSARATAVALIKEIFEGPLMEAGMRRPPSADAMTKDIEGCNVVADVPSSSVITQYLKGIRAIGTMEHSAIMLNGTEAETLFFVQWFLMYGQFSTALIDSRTPEEGVKAAIRAQEIINELRPALEKDPAYAHLKTWTIPSIRLDSGDIRSQAKTFRKMLDDAGMQATKITIMDGMHHEKLKKILFDEDGGAVHIDAVGAGESIRFPVAKGDDGKDYRWISNLIYKATRLYHADEPVEMMKLSATPSKATRPTRALYRVLDADGKLVRDVAGLDRADGAKDLPVAPKGGKVVERMAVLAEGGKPAAMFETSLEDYWKSTRTRFAGELRSLPMTWKERDAARTRGEEWRPRFEESPALLDAVLDIADQAGRREEFAKALGRK